MRKKIEKQKIVILVLLTIIGGFLRFYNLAWGDGYLFHPDERNIAYAIGRLQFPGKLNPEFFAYAGFPIYLVYFLGVGVNWFRKISFSFPSQDIFIVNTPQAIILGRFLSALLSTLMIPLVYIITQNCLKIKPQRKKTLFPLFSAVLTTFCVGLIQYAHFSTFEIFLTFEYLLVLYFALRILKKPSWTNYLLLGLCLGLSLATKIVSLAILPILPLTAISSYFLLRKKRENIFLSVFKSLINLKLLVSLLLTASLGLLFSPYTLLDYASFRYALNYESGVATGSLPVFYTALFLQTIPGIYQLFHVFPFILGFFLTPLAVLACLAILIVGLKDFFTKKDPFFLVLLAIPTFYLAFHFSLFVKWTRYMIPVIPFLIIITVAFLSFLEERRSRLTVIKQTSLANLVLVVTLTLTTLQGLSFFNIYLQTDTRVAAAAWAKKNLPAQAKFLSELWDLGIITFNDQFPVKNITLFNFYELDGDPFGESKLSHAQQKTKLEKLVGLLVESDYVVLPSSRVYETRMRLPQRFPIGSRFYQKLFDGSLGFEKIAEINSKPLLWPERAAEETFKVFDHPQVIIFEKRQPRAQTEYENLLTL